MAKAKDEHDKSKDVEAGDIVDGDGPGGPSDVEVMAAPQLDDDDAVEISFTEDPADEDEAPKPAEGHEAEADMIDEDVDPGPPVVTTSVPPVIVEDRESDDLEDSPEARKARQEKTERALAEGRKAEGDSAK